MSKLVLILIVLLGALTLLFYPLKATPAEITKEQYKEALVRDYLTSKDSPMAEYADVLMSQKHWQLLLGISAIESQYCKKKIGNNCFGIGADEQYRHYKTIGDSIVDAEKLITKWQAKGKWLTPEQMNCSYVVPCNPNWVLVVNQTIKKINAITSR